MWKNGMDIAWCPGCGNFALLDAVNHLLETSEIPRNHFLYVSGIGQAAKLPHYLKGVSVLNGLHGRALPVAQAAKIANGDLTVVVHSGDGCNYGEGGNHLLAAMRRNVDITLIVHDNQIYGLTKGQASPTTSMGTTTVAQTLGVMLEPFSPLATAVALDCSFVARTFVGDPEHMATTMRAAIRHHGFALVDVLQQCVTFNKINTFGWYKERVQKLPDDYDPTDRQAAFAKALEWGDHIPIGVLYVHERPSYGDLHPALHNKPALWQNWTTDMAPYGALLDELA
jgi:2-oxoglutarate ferredoxin oxidoreductase subunit beta